MLLKNSTLFHSTHTEPHQATSIGQNLFEQSQTGYIQHLKSLIPHHFQIKLQTQSQSESSIFDRSFLSAEPKQKKINNKKQLDLSMNAKSTIQFPSRKKLQQNSHNKTSESNVLLKASQQTLQDFVLSLFKAVSNPKLSPEHLSDLELVLKELGIDVRIVQSLEGEEERLSFMLQSFDKNIEEQRRKITCSSKIQRKAALNKQNSNMVSTSSSRVKAPLNSYQALIKEQQKKRADNFAWLEINTKYPMIEKKLKAKLIQSINEDKNEKNVRELLAKKAANVKGSKFYDSKLEDAKVEIENESLFLEEFEKGKLEYTWAQCDEQMLRENLQQLKVKCINRGEFIKICGRFKYISHQEFETLACGEICRKLNKDNKIYLSREFLLDKYFSTTETLTEQEMRFILKTSPTLSKCVDRTFVKSAIRNIKYENISDLELKIADDIIAKLERLRACVKESRQQYTTYTNHNIKRKVERLERNRHFHLARQIARSELEKHKASIEKVKKHSSSYKLGPGKSVNSPQNNSIIKGPTSYHPLNKYHVATGLFAKDCNEQCTDDVFNPYEQLYIDGRLEFQIKSKDKNSVENRAKMLEFYTGGPNENILTTFNETKADVQNICQTLKALFFEKKVSVALQSVNLCLESSRESTAREGTRCNLTMVDIKTRRTMALLPSTVIQEDIEAVARRKMIQNRQKVKQTIYINKLLFLSAENSLQSLKALNPYFSPQQVNTKDKKGNSALFYCAKNNNEEFADYILKFGGNPNLECSGKNTPLHMAFRANNTNLILKLFTSQLNPPDLNLLNAQNKTPLGCATRKTLRKLGLQTGVSYVDPKGGNPFSFDNNELLEREKHDRIKEDPLEMNDSIQIKYKRREKRTLTSIQNMDYE